MADLQRATTEERASHLPERSHLAHQEPHIILSAILVRVGQETGVDVPTVAIRVSSRASLKGIARIVRMGA